MLVRLAAIRNSRKRTSMPDHTPDQGEATSLDPNLRRGPSPMASASVGDDATFPIVGIGALAGGLEACRRLLRALPDGRGMALILVQHLDPNHDSMLVDLLAGYTSMTVRQASDGMLIERGHLYVIPPGTYLSIGNRLLHVSPPQARHGARLPFDFLLHSLAAERGAAAVCVILSGTGSDGSAGLRAIKNAGGLVIAQDPDEAGYNGMPSSAIMTGAVDRVLPIEGIAAALHGFNGQAAVAKAGANALQDAQAQDWLPAIIDLLRTRTAHDFTLYKPGTLLRRIARRIGAAAVAQGDMKGYRKILLSDPKELDLLAKDLLINVTGFFRDPLVFDLLTRKIVPDIVRDHPPDRPIRIWIAGCSTGEETYSLAMLFREAITAAGINLKLQVFASDVDPDAIAIARDGSYPETIAAEVTPARLARFFSKEDHAYRISPELRAAVVFTVQDVLADPPFSRLEMVSCRNLLIYLRPEAQAKVLGLFHFALRERGVLLLGSAETVGNADDRFEVISKAERLYRHIGRSRPGGFGFSGQVNGGARLPARLEPGQPPSRQAVLAELCQRLVMETYAPAAVLINRKHECLFSLGPIDRYLHVATGLPTHDLLAMVRPGMRTKLRSAIHQATQQNTRVVAAGRAGSVGNPRDDGFPRPFSIAVQPVVSNGEQLHLVCFLDSPEAGQSLDREAAPQDAPQVVDLEQELDATRTELQGAIHNLEISGEELQSLNEELTALNGQLQETLERQRTTSNDLQNVLYSTDVATLFLDLNLNIRFFTPASRALFNIIPSDLGRPLSDLNSLAADGALLSDVRSVLRTVVPQEREIEAQNGAWYIRRVLPYRTQDNGVEGVVITFVDITERRRAADALDASKRQAEQANAAKSRFLAAASHDLRQPLQTLALVQGLLAKIVQGERAQKLVARFEDTMGAMSGMLNTLLDINQIDAGTIKVEMIDFPIDRLLHRLRDEFSYHAQATGLALHVVSCGLLVFSDPRLLEQMIRNLLSNALKYTPRGKVLLGCRRRGGGRLSVEVWDTGIGIPGKDLQVIFDEYHQLDNAAREHSRGLSCVTEFSGSVHR